MTAMSVGLQAPVGVGMPQGVVTAPVGSVYTDTAATNGAIRWIKQTGTGNTGWQVIFGDTGWQNATPLLTNGWTASGLYVRRVNETVTCQFSGLNADSATDDIATSALGTGWTLFNNPIGGNPVFRFPTGVGGIAGSASSQLTAMIQGNQSIIRFDRASFPAPGSVTLTGRFRWVTADTWPAVLPPTP